MDLTGKVAIITGAARGQGEAEARLFAARGAQVVLTDVLVEEGEAVAASIGAAARFQRHDVGSESDWLTTVELALSEFGGSTRWSTTRRSARSNPSWTTPPSRGNGSCAST